MKREKGISLVLLTLIIVAILVVGTIAIVLVLNRDSNKEKGIEESNTSVDTTYKTEQNNNIDEIVTENNKFWVDNHQNWGEQKEKFTLTLFDGKFTTPIDLKSADSFAKQYKYITDEEKYVISEKNADSIDIILNSKDVIWEGNSSKIHVKYGELNENNRYQDSITIEIENFNDANTTLKECLENNWWYIKEDFELPAKTLGIDMSNEPEYNDETMNSGNWNVRPLLDKVVEELGGPKHIYVTERYSYEQYESIDYLLSYEYENYSVILEVSELWQREASPVSQIDSITYYNNICRDKELDKLKGLYELNPNSYVKFEIMK